MSQLWDFNVIYVPFGTWRTGVSMNAKVIRQVGVLELEVQVLQAVEPVYESNLNLILSVLQPPRST